MKCCGTPAVKDQAEGEARRCRQQPNLDADQFRLRRTLGVVQHYGGGYFLAQCGMLKAERDCFRHGGAFRKAVAGE